MTPPLGALSGGEPSAFCRKGEDDMAADILPGGVVSYSPVLPNRLQRRKQRTRAALIKAAQHFIAAGNINVPVLEITRAADVGMGSFYNHFDTKEQLYQAALQEIFDRRGAVLDVLPKLEDPAETFACRFRLNGRMFRRRPHESRALLDLGLGPIVADRGLAPRALRDIKAGQQAGRFHVDDPELALALAAGALLGLNQLLHDQAERDDAQAADSFAEDLLRVYGLPPEDARDVCRRELPDLDRLAIHDVFGVEGR
jgi:AcrR family transcriptional regulator